MTYTKNNKIIALILISSPIHLLSLFPYDDGLDHWTLVSHIAAYAGVILWQGRRMSDGCLMPMTPFRGVTVSALKRHLSDRDGFWYKYRTALMEEL